MALARLRYDSKIALVGRRSASHQLDNARGDDVAVPNRAKHAWTPASLDHIEVFESGENIAALCFMAFKLDAQAQVIHAVCVA